MAAHLQTGEPAAMTEVDQWLRNHGVRTVNWPDAFAACTHLLIHANEVPDLVLIGLEWLPTDEVDIARYIRETWPGVGMVLYGAATEKTVLDSDARMIRCSTIEALQEVLRRRPDALQEELSAGAPQTLRMGDRVAVHPRDEQEGIRPRDERQQKLPSANLSREEWEALLTDPDREESSE